MTKASGGLHGRVRWDGWCAIRPLSSCCRNVSLIPQSLPGKHSVSGRKYRKRVEALLERKILAPARLRLPPAEREHAEKFLAYWRSLGPPVSTDVVKIDLSKTVIGQFCVVSEVADSYSAREAVCVSAGTGSLVRRSSALGALPASGLLARKSDMRLILSRNLCSAIGEARWLGVRRLHRWTPDWRFPTRENPRRQDHSVCPPQESQPDANAGRFRPTAHWILEIHFVDRAQ